MQADRYEQSPSFLLPQERTSKWRIPQKAHLQPSERSTPPMGQQSALKSGLEQVREYREIMR